MQLDDSTEIEAHAAAIVVAAEQARRVRVHVHEGVPRRRLLDGLERGLERTAVVVLPPLNDPDASLHGLLQAAAFTGPKGVEQALQDGSALRDRARTNAQAVARDGRALVVWAPSSWTAGDETVDPERQIRRSAAEEVLGGWLSVEELTVIVLAHASSDVLIDRSAGVAASWRDHSVEPPVATLPEDAAWGSYAEAATSLRKALSLRPRKLIGQQLRLLVALVGLGSAPGYLLDGPIAARDLVKRLSEVLEQRTHRDVAAGVGRFLEARWPVPREVASEIARVPDEHQALITNCLGESAHLIDVDERLRDGLRKRPRTKDERPAPDPSVHLALADYHESLDGAPRPAGTWSQIAHWLEKAHHLGLSGPEGAERWERLERPTRELYWDRARSLSFDHQQYLEAARLYQECIDRFDRRDAYSWHYLGFNLDRAGVRRKDAERAFRKAVEIRPDHPWYNGRLVTFLIDQARFRAAEEEWQSALDRMDPGGENVAESPWLAREVHRWVVKAWLRFGEIGRARAVLDDIPGEVFRGERWYEDLREALGDAEEAAALGESVYPSSTPMLERWVVPREVLLDAPARLRSWFPGRVAAVDTEGIHLALAVPNEDPEKRRLIARTLTPDEWRARARFDPEEGRFVFVAIYTNDADPNGTVRIVAQPARTARADDEAEAESMLRYLHARRR